MITVERVVALLDEMRAQHKRAAITRMLVDGVSPDEIEAFEALHDATWRAESQRVVAELLAAVDADPSRPEPEP